MRLRRIYRTRLAGLMNQAPTEANLIAGNIKGVERILLSLPERFSGLKIDWDILMFTHLHVIFLFEGMKEGLPEVVRGFKALVSRKKMGFRKPARSKDLRIL